MADTRALSGGSDRNADALAMIRSVAPSDGFDGAAQHLERLCTAATDGLGLLGAAVRLLQPGGTAGVTVAGRETPAGLVDIEFDVGEGPGATSYAQSRPVLVSDLAGLNGSEWPGFQHAAVEQGVAAVFAFPLHLGAVSLGTLELFSPLPGPLTQAEVALARAFTEIGVVVLLDGQPTDHDGALSPGFERAFEHRADIAQAQGMVMVDLGVSLVEAITRLRAHAFATGVSLSDLARTVIDGYALPAATGAQTTWTQSDDREVDVVISTNRMAEVFVEVADSLVGDFDLIDFLHGLTLHTTEVTGSPAVGLLLSDDSGGLNHVAASTEDAQLPGAAPDCSTRRGPASSALRPGVPLSRILLPTVTAGRTSHRSPSLPASRTSMLSRCGCGRRSSAP